MRFVRIFAVIAALGAGGWWIFGDDFRRPPPPGVVAAEEPMQGPVEGENQEWTAANSFHITALASYRIHARVLGVKHYGYDRGSAVAPVDLALGWGRMSDWSVYGRLDVAQRGRFYLYRWGPEGPPIPSGEIITHSANNHIIPANDQVASILKEVRLHDVVWMEGELVEVHGPGGFSWRSSLRRDDTGNGACELFRVTDLVIEPPANP